MTVTVTTVATCIPSTATSSVKYAATDSPITSSTSTTTLISSYSTSSTPVKNPSTTTNTAHLHVSMHVLYICNHYNYVDFIMQELAATRTETIHQVDVDIIAPPVPAPAIPAPSVPVPPVPAPAVPAPAVPPVGVPQPFLAALPGMVPPLRLVPYLPRHQEVLGVYKFTSRNLYDHATMALGTSLGGIAVANATLSFGR